MTNDERSMTTPMSHTLTYHIHSHDIAEPIRTIEVEANEAQLQQLQEQGFLVRERLIQGELLKELRAAVDEIAAQRGGSEGSAANTSRQFGGLFVRNLLDLHPTFL